ncbi:MAG TPA: STAS domain-containing protein [Terriglobales bacterium]|jgi:anti-anti-sigma regulatory factor|nr:STAS domain-containing protein [Terriglobales bacterium]
MTKPPPMTVKRLPEPCDKASRRFFLREIKGFVDNSHRPRLIVDLSAVEQISPESIDLLLECVGHAERGDGEVSVAGASPETGVILEITQAASVLNMFPSVLEAANGRELRDFESWQPRYPGDRAA